MYKVLTISGKSCSGKTYLQNKLLEKYPYLTHKVKQFTTREKRKNENGNEYYFIKDLKEDAIGKKQILEMKSFNNGTTYGTFIEELQEDKINILVCNLNCVEQIKLLSHIIEVFPIVIEVKNEITRLERIYHRGDYKTAILRLIEDEREFSNSYSFSPLYINDISDLGKNRKFENFIRQF